MSFSLHVDPIAGSDMQKHFSELLAFSKKLDVILTTEINGEAIVVAPYHNVKGLMKTYGYEKQYTPKDKPHE